MDSKDLILAAPGVYRSAAKAIQLKSYKMALLAKVLDGVSEGTESEIDAGIHGYVHIHIKTNVPKTFGKIAGGVSDALKSISGYIVNKVDELEAEASQVQLQDHLDLISANIESLNTLVSTRVSNSSFSTLESSVASGFSSIGTSLSEMDTASQTRLAELGDVVDEGAGLKLRIRIEDQLSDSNRQLAVFYLPESRGGLLEQVREVTADTIDQSVEAGLYSEAFAGEELAKGDTALAAGDYRLAFESFRRSYQDAVKWPIGVSVSLSDTEDAISLSWSSEEGDAYSVDASEDLVEWRDLYHILNSREGRTEVTRSPTAPTEFYRVIREIE